LNFRHIVWFTFLLLLQACSSIPTTEKRSDTALHLANSQGWQSQILTTSSHKLQSFVPKNSKPSKRLTIYIEGDGLAWLSRRKISSDPTPIDPLVLKLAVQDKQAVYLARPCQYIKSDNCDKKVWTSARFSSEVVQSMSQAVTELKNQFQASSLRLIGYSGGGAIATLLAAERDDVDQLVTVAGNIDTTAWTEMQHISALTDSLNPADAWQKLTDVPQIHFVGSEDKIMPEAVAKSYQQHFPNSKQPEVRVITGMTHHCCWTEHWPELLMEISASDLEIE
jgi:pimeloyl-ACP methyl ester carboxylesterase